MSDFDLHERVAELEAEVAALRRQFDTVIRSLTEAKLNHRQKQTMNRQLAENARRKRAKKKTKKTR